MGWEPQLRGSPNRFLPPPGYCVRQTSLGTVVKIYRIFLYAINSALDHRKSVSLSESP